MTNVAASAVADYPLNQWYCAAFSTELGQQPLARTICDRQIVLYRGEGGRAVALTDRCPHRKAPLSGGRVLGDNIECPFHGMLFAPDGSCVDIPCQRAIPPAANVRSFPVVERHGHVWLWPGSAPPDEGLVPDMHWLVDPALSAVNGVMEIACNYLAALDNLLDDTHLSFVHRNTIGTPKIVKADIDIEGDADWVGFARWTLDTPPSAMHAMAGGFTTNVDRWFNVRFTKPSTVLIDVGSAPVGSGAPQGNRASGISLFSNGTVTPSTPATCLYFWHTARTFKVGDAAFSTSLRAHMEETFIEDKEILEAVQRNRACDAEKLPDLNLAGDAVTVRARRIIAALVEKER
ncbi:MAG: aromatic ring-hydroxylating dioxygenase subunit alpha [Proteobacteria bacterium]|nr:aromatic ring-hydroxylating dioxygenase subunit alpha [Pseudomonadota bacterium]